MEAFPCATALCILCSFLHSIIPSLCSFFNSVVVSSLRSFLDPVVTIVIIIDVITSTIVVIVTEGNVITSTIVIIVIEVNVATSTMSFPMPFPMPFPNGSLPKIGGIVVVVVVIVALSVVVMVAFAFCALSPFAPLSKLASTFHVTNLDIVFVSGLRLGRFFEHGRNRVKIHHWVGGEVRYAIRLSEEL
jgi:hypothetical protein